MVCKDRTKTCSSCTSPRTALYSLEKTMGATEVETPIPFQRRHTSCEVSWKALAHAHRKEMETNHEAQKALHKSGSTKIPREKRKKGKRISDQSIQEMEESQES